MAKEKKDAVVKLAERYKKLETKRSDVLERARECSKLTIPSLLPPDGSDETTSLYKPFQSLGARGVNNLASKLMLTLMPPNNPFFKFTVDPVDVEASGQKNTEVDSALSEMEWSMVRDIEASGDRVAIFQFLRLLIVTGNALLYFPENEEGKAKIKVYKLDNYVVNRDPLGNLLEIVIKESIAPMAIPNEEVRQKVLADTSKRDNTKEFVELYTGVKLDKDSNKWLLTQEVNGEVLTEAEYEREELPFLAIRWNALAGEHYGRSHVDECMGDLRSLEGLRQAILEASSASAKVLIFVDPNGTTRTQDVAKAENLEVIDGRAEEVTAFQLNKNADLAVIRETINDLKKDISFHFLLNSSIQRQGERVTAEEIKTMAGELEEALGGTYTVLAVEFQLPYVQLKLRQMRRDNKFPEGTEAIEPVITTGLEGLSRGHDYNKIRMFLGSAKELGLNVSGKLNEDNILKQLAIATGLNPADVVLNGEQQAQNNQTNVAQNMMDKATGPVAGKLAQGMVDGSIQMPQM